MNNDVDVIAGVGLDQRTRKSHWPAKLDFVQSASGLFLGLFMWGHMAFVSTILISKDAMWWVTKMFEGQFILGKSYSGIVAAVVALVSFMFVLHGLLAMRKFPANFQEYKSFASHRQMLRHEDTTLWWVQAWTGFALFFLASVHLYQMLMHPGDIGPYESAERVWSGRWWPLYLVLLFAVELHGGVGLYRLAVKWGWFEGEDPNRTRVMLKRLKWAITIFFLTLGLLTLAAYMKLGHERRDRLGERYVPSYGRVLRVRRRTALSYRSCKNSKHEIRNSKQFQNESKEKKF
jgi:fumarate reductase subunit C